MFSAFRVNKELEENAFKKDMLGFLLGSAEKYYLICNQKKGYIMKKPIFSYYGMSNELQDKEKVRKQLIFQMRLYQEVNKIKTSALPANVNLGDIFGKINEWKNSMDNLNDKYLYEGIIKLLKNEYIDVSKFSYHKPVYNYVGGENKTIISKISYQPVYDYVGEGIEEEEEKGQKYKQKGIEIWKNNNLSCMVKAIEYFRLAESYNYSIEPLKSNCQLYYYLYKAKNESKSKRISNLYEATKYEEDGIDVSSLYEKSNHISDLQLASSRKKNDISYLQNELNSVNNEISGKQSLINLKRSYVYNKNTDINKLNELVHSLTSEENEINNKLDKEIKEGKELIGNIQTNIEEKKKSSMN